MLAKLDMRLSNLAILGTIAMLGACAAEVGAPDMGSSDKHDDPLVRASWEGSWELTVRNGEIEAGADFVVDPRGDSSMAITYVQLISYRADNTVTGSRQVRVEDDRDVHFVVPEDAAFVTLVYGTDLYGDAARFSRIIGGGPRVEHGSNWSALVDGPIEAGRPLLVDRGTDFVDWVVVDFSSLELHSLEDRSAVLVHVPADTTEVTVAFHRRGAVDKAVEESFPVSGGLESTTD